MPQSTSPANERLRLIGLDVSKTTIALHDSASGRCITVANTCEALSAALQPFAGYDLAVCETTGGYERAVLDAAFALGLAIHRADAARVKAFIASHGGQAKTDAIDAAWLARYGAERFKGLARWHPPSPEHEALAELVRHRQDLLAQRVQAKNRHKAPGGRAIKAMLAEQIDFLSCQIGELEEKIADIMKASSDLARRAAALRKIEGLGPACASTLLALGPELGTLTPKTAASLFGLAPHARDSGTHHGYRRMRGGRAGIKPLLFLAALSAARHHPRLSTFYKRLLQAGKPKRLALAAVARKLIVIANAVLRDLDGSNPKLT